MLTSILKEIHIFNTSTTSQEESEQVRLKLSEQYDNHQRKRYDKAQLAVGVGLMLNIHPMPQRMVYHLEWPKGHIASDASHIADTT